MSSRLSSENDLTPYLDPSSSVQEAANLFPKTEEETDKVEEILEKEMESLSIDERDKITFDIHGFSERKKEDDTTINELLEHMHRVLRKRVENREAYLIAKSMNKGYVTDRDFCLMFLRSENYDATLAARKMATHFTIKKELFGSGEILGRDIRLSDLSEDDTESLRAGLFQVFPSRDVAGRIVIALAPSRRVCKSLDSVARTYWYTFMTCLRNDVEMQQKGFVLVVYTRYEFPEGTSGELQFLRRLHQMRQGIPKKLAACHCCGLDTLVRPLDFGIRLFLPRELRTRFRSHYGSYADTIFKLQTFGIKAEDHPIEHDGSLSLTWHHEWLRIQKSKEESNIAANDGVLAPGRFDVLFGRSRLTRGHSGNLRAAHLVDMYQAEYEIGGKLEKTKLAEHILNIIHKSGGRFMKWEDEGWVEVDHEVARNKISHFFRLNRSKRKDEKTDDTLNNSSKRRSPELTQSGGEVSGEKTSKRVCDF